jgi:tetratricopeptide (TPR) repeat protein
MPVPSNISPSFARDASHYLQDADFQRALELCLSGTKAFPSYSTGFLVLGKCYEAIGRTAESLAAYRKALAVLPDNLMLQSLIRRAEEAERKELKQPTEVKTDQHEAQAVTSSAPQTHEPSTEESAIEYLAKRLQDVKRIQPKVTEGEERVSQEGYRSLKFVTATMAEIYVGQGEYTEAIAAYQELIRQHPEQASTYEKRRDEIRQLLDIQQSEKTLKGPNKNAS